MTEPLGAMVESNDKLRISDADRELVSKLLKVAIDEGRLTLGEYDERLRQAYEAKTVGELAPIISDLPRVADGGVEVVRPRMVSVDPSELLTGTPQWIKWLWISWMIPVSITSLVWVLTLLTGAGTWYPWPLWVAGPLGAIYLSLTVGERVTRADRLASEAQRRAERRGRR
ncbi:DUF1707 domain-containing protein [Phytomonospora sp. NPDC050363]|uniref:DUF1707 SHOCT-like domain-containing protein n=1 Tax=Phytomonospora sp. NPDC050363 TaxID=3155642 RepID=UPI0033C73413